MCSVKKKKKIQRSLEFPEGATASSLGHMILHFPMSIKNDVYTHMQKCFSKSNLKEAKKKKASQLAKAYRQFSVTMYPSGGHSFKR